MKKVYLSPTLRTLRLSAAALQVPNSSDYDQRPTTLQTKDDYTDYPEDDAANAASRGGRHGLWE